MRISVYLPWLAAAVLALVTPQVAGRLHPRLGATALSAAAAAVAAASTWSLVLLATALLEYSPPVQERTSARPVPLLASTAAALALAAVGRRARHARDVRRCTTASLHRVCRLCPDGGELAVTADDDVYAFAVPGRPGRILVSSGLLRVATPAQRRVVLAHERAHLQQGHHLRRAVVELAAAANPLLVSTRDAVEYLVERAADEDAALAVGSRREAALALADVALAVGRTDMDAGGALGFHRHGVVDRVAALVRPPVGTSAWLAIACLTGAACAVFAAADATLALGRFVIVVAGL